MEFSGAGKELDAAGAAIAARRAAVGDEAMEALATDPLGVIGYVCSHRNVAPDVLAADALDALRAVRLLRAVLDRQELALIGIAREQRVPWARLATALGLRSRQAAEQRRLRLDALRAGDGRDEVAARERHRRTHREGSWLARRRADILAAGAAAAAAPFRSADVTEAAEALGEAALVTAPSCVEVMAWLSHLLTEARHAGELDRLDQRTRARVERLVADWEKVRPPVHARTAARAYEG